MSVAMKLTPSSSSYKDLEEWDEGTARLVFPDNEGVSFGDGRDGEFYSDGSALCRSLNSLGLALDNDRLVDRFSAMTLVPTQASVPYKEQNYDGGITAGIALQNRSLYLVSTDGNEAALLFANLSNLLSAVQVEVDMDSLSLNIKGDAATAIQIGDTNDTLAELGATPVGKATHITDPAADAGELATAVASIIDALEAKGILATS